MKINLFFFISQFNFGGAGNAIFNFLKNLDKRKYNLHMIFIGHSDYEKLLPKHVKFYKLTINAFFFKTFFSFFLIRKILLQKDLINKKNIFISNIHYSNVLSIIFLRNIQHLKLILFERTSLKELNIFYKFLPFLKNQIVKLLIKYTYLKADKVLVNSRTSVKELKELKIKSSIVYSGSLNKAVKRNKFIKKNFFKIIAVGRLTYQKDYFTLLDAIKNIKNKNFILKIYGDGELKDRLIYYIENNDLKKYVKLNGHETDTRKIYSNADLLIHSAIFEGLPNTVVEAMNYEIPVIASNSFGGTKEVLNNGKFGDLFNPGDSIGLRKMIQNFLINPIKLKKKVIKSKSFLKRFNKKNSCKSLEKILMSI